MKIIFITFFINFLWLYISFMVCGGSTIGIFSTLVPKTLAAPLEREVASLASETVVYTEESTWRKFVSYFQKNPVQEASQETSQAAENDIHGISDTFLLSDGLSIRPLVEELPQRGQTTADMISHLVEKVVDAFKRVIGNIRNKYRDIHDFYTLFFPLQEPIPLVPERPNTMIGRLEEKWDNRPTPIRDANIAFQKKLIADRADSLIQQNMAWLPSSLHPKTKKWLIDHAPWLFDALCNGKTHINPRVQQWATDIQFKIARSNPTLNNLVLESICIFKKSHI